MKDFGAMLSIELEPTTDILAEVGRRKGDRLVIADLFDLIDQTEIRIGVSVGCAFGPIDGAKVLSWSAPAR